MVDSEKQAVFLFPETNSIIQWKYILFYFIYQIITKSVLRDQ
jgi:hypothetical protein